MDRSGVMYDQAYQLRQLVSRIRPVSGEEQRSAISVRVYGVRQGVGTSKIVHALAQYWCKCGWNVYLANGRPNPEITDFVNTFLRWDGCHDVAEAIVQHRGHEQQAIRVAPAPINGNEVAVAASRKTVLLKDCGVVDDREGLTLEGVGGLVLVTTPAPTDIMKAYVVTKRTVRRIASGTLTIVINKCPDLSVGEEMAKRLRNACERFLGPHRINQFILPIFPEIEGQLKSQTPRGESGSAQRPSELVTGTSSHSEDNGRDPVWKTIRLIARTIMESATCSGAKSGQE